MRIILSAVALATIAAPASAVTPGDETVTVRVNFADIDLSTAQGRAALEARIEANAREACTIEANSRYGYGRDIVDETCVTEARGVALAEAARLASAEIRANGAISAN